MTKEIMLKTNNNIGLKIHGNFSDEIASVLLDLYKKDDDKKTEERVFTQEDYNVLIEHHVVVINATLPMTGIDVIIKNLHERTTNLNVLFINKNKQSVDLIVDQCTQNDIPVFESMEKLLTKIGAGV